MTASIGERQATEAPARRRRRLVPFPRASALVGYAVISTAMFLVLLELFSFVVLRWVDWRRERLFSQGIGELHCQGVAGHKCPPNDDFESASPAFDGKPWVDEFWRSVRELNALPNYYNVPFVGWMNIPFHSTYLNDDPSPLGVVRRTIQPQRPCQGAPAQVWMLGGSTMYGYGAPDQGTIASSMADAIAGKGVCVQVVNMAVPGYNTNQELVQLLLALKQGYRPDIVIMFDGENEAYTGIFEGHVHGVMGFDPEAMNMPDNWPWVGKANSARLVAALLHRLAIRSSDRQVAPSGDIVRKSIGEEQLSARVRETLDNYESNCRAVRMLGQKFGFRALFFWQPSLLYGAKPAVPFERAVLRQRNSGDKQAEGSALRAGYIEADKRSRDTGEFIFLGSIFDSVSAPVYLDDVHLGPLGNRLVGERIADELLRSGAGKRPDLGYNVR